MSSAAPPRSGRRSDQAEVRVRAGARPPPNLTAGTMRRRRRSRTMTGSAIPAEMDAAVLRDFGELTVERVPVPQPAAGEVLCRVLACGICGTDLKIVAGDYRGHLAAVAAVHHRARVVRRGRRARPRHRTQRACGGRPGGGREPHRLRCLPDVPGRTLQPVRAGSRTRLQALRSYRAGSAGGVRGTPGGRPAPGASRGQRRGGRARQPGRADRARGQAGRGWNQAPAWPCSARACSACSCCRWPGPPGRPRSSRSGRGKRLVTARELGSTGGGGLQRRRSGGRGPRRSRRPRRGLRVRLLGQPGGAGAGHAARPAGAGPSRCLAWRAAGARSCRSTRWYSTS